MKAKSKKLTILLAGIALFILSTSIVSAYSAPGQKWSGTSTTYYINNVFATSFKTAFQTADATWDAAGSKFRFTYTGTTSRNPNTTSTSYSRDTYNDIGYYNDGATGHQAATRISAYSSGSIIEVDTTMNIYYGFTTVGASGSYDVQDTMTHEFGHWLRLADLTVTTSPSYCGSSSQSTLCNDSVSIGSTERRSLSTDDKNGIKYIYGT